MKISVGIITRNRQDVLKNCIDSITRNDAKPDEIIIVDNNSSDNTKKLIHNYKKNCPNIKYFFEKNVGRPYARKKLLSVFHGEILALTDDDCILDASWIKNIKNAFKKNPTALAIQGKAISQNKNAEISRILQKKQDSWFEKNIYGNKISILDTKNCAIKMPAIKKIAIDTNLIHEDIDMSKQLNQFGIKIIYDNKIIVYHQERNFPQLIFQWFRIGKHRAEIENKWNERPSTKQTEKNKFSSTHFIIQISYRFGYLYQKIRNTIISLKKTINNNYDISRLKKIYPYNIGKHKKLTVSVGIITKNRPEMLDRCLKSLLLQNQKPFETIIIDSSNTPHTFEEKTKKLLNIKYYLVNQGFGKARNEIIRLASGNIVTFLDDDIVAHIDWISDISHSHSINPEIAIQGRVVSKIDSIWALNEKINLDTWFLKNLKSDNYIELIANKNISYKTSLLVKNNLLYEERYQVERYGSEDILMFEKLKKNGYRVKYDPKITVIHRERKSLIEYLKQQYRKGKARKYTLHRQSIPKNSYIINTSQDLLLDMIFYPKQKYSRLSVFFIKILSALITLVGIYF